MVEKFLKLPRVAYTGEISINQFHKSSGFQKNIDIVIEEDMVANSPADHEDEFRWLGDT